MLDTVDGGPAEDILPVCGQVQVKSCPPEVGHKRDKEENGKIRVIPGLWWSTILRLDKIGKTNSQANIQRCIFFRDACFIDKKADDKQDGYDHWGQHTS